MKIEKGIDGAWYAVWQCGGEAYDHLDDFPGCSEVCHFGQYENAIRLTDGEAPL